MQISIANLVKFWHIWREIGCHGGRDKLKQLVKITAPVACMADGSTAASISCCFTEPELHAIGFILLVFVLISGASFLTTDFGRQAVVFIPT